VRQKEMSEIRQWREKASLTQQRMSELFDIPKRTIENWEAGVRKPPAYVEKLIVEKLKQMTEER
jgi:DNA-binding transcriptional regulator YiaG